MSAKQGVKHTVTRESVATKNKTPHMEHYFL